MGWDGMESEWGVDGVWVGMGGVEMPVETSCRNLSTSPRAAALHMSTAPSTNDTCLLDLVPELEGLSLGDRHAAMSTEELMSPCSTPVRGGVAVSDAAAPSRAAPGDEEVNTTSLHRGDDPAGDAPAGDAPPSPDARPLGAVFGGRQAAGEEVGVVSQPASASTEPWRCTFGGAIFRGIGECPLAGKDCDIELPLDSCLSGRPSSRTDRSQSAVVPCAPLEENDWCRCSSSLVRSM